MFEVLKLNFQKYNCMQKKPKHKAVVYQRELYEEKNKILKCTNR